MKGKIFSIFIWNAVIIACTTTTEDAIGADCVNYEDFIEPAKFYCCSKNSSCCTKSENGPCITADFDRCRFGYSRFCCNSTSRRCTFSEKHEDKKCYYNSLCRDPLKPYCCSTKCCSKVDYDAEVIPCNSSSVCEGGKRYCCDLTAACCSREDRDNETCSSDSDCLRTSSPYCCSKGKCCSIRIIFGQTGIDIPNLLVKAVSAVISLIVVVIACVAYVKYRKAKKRRPVVLDDKATPALL